MRRSVRIGLAAAAVAAGAGCVLLGRAVLGERAAIDRADASLAAPLPAPTSAAAGGLAGLLLGTADDRAAREAAATYVRARSQTALAPAVRLSAAARRELAPLAVSGPPARRSWASTLTAVLELDAARLDRRNAQEHVRASVAALRAAVAADPGDEQAKRDLELVLTLQQKGKSQSNGAGKAGGKQGRRQPKSGHGKPHAGASARPAGDGW